MFPSAGLFSETDCPFLTLGGCERPYCPYKHVKEEENTGVCAGSARAAPEKGHGNHNAASRTFHNHEQSQTCLSELERINKQIEAVRNEVEKEQKRLSRYQSEQAESAGVSSEEYFVTRKTRSKDQNGNQLKCKKATPAARKYVVDRTKPKTDLEYDPCSNFSADLRSGSSTDKMKSTNKADVERDQRDKGKGKSISADPILVPSCNFEDSDEEGELVIDIPPFENDGNKRSQIQSSSPSENADFIKITRESSEMAPLDTDMPLLEKKAEKIRPAKKDMTSINEQQESLKSLYKETNVVKPRHSIPQREKMPSEGVLAVRSIPIEGEQKPSVHPRMAKEEPELSKRMMEIDALPAENNEVLHKSLKQNLAASKNDKCKEEILNYATKNSPELHENTRSFSVSDFSQVGQLEKLIPANSMNAGVYQEKAQNIENVLDDISICLDHLRRESESIACLQDVDASLLDTIPSAPSCSKIHGDHSLQPVTQRLQRRTEPEVQPNNWLSGHIKKMDTLPLGQSSENTQKTSVFQDYLPTTSSFQAITKDPGSCQNTPASADTNWPFAQKVPAEPVVQNVPLYVSGTSTAMVPSPHTELNPAATSVDLPGCQILQKPPALLGATDKIAVDSSSSDELNYSDLDLSESDPMEECYRIFMEANKAEDPTVQGDMPEEVSKMSEAEMVKPVLAQKKRVAHVAKFEVSKNKAQVIVPLRDGGFQLPVPSQSQQCQKRATSITAAVKGCQSFIAANAAKRVLTPTVIHPTAVPNNCVNILPVGATLRIGPNLHLIVPEGSCALPVTLIPAAAVPAARPVHQPAPIPQPAQPAQPTNYTPAKSIPTKRKARGRAEVGVKVPHDVRQRYVNLFVEEFLKTSATVQDAFEKALAEEKTVFDRSINKLKYLSIAVNALKRLKNQNAAPAKFSSERDAQASRGNVPLNTQALLQNGDTTLYNQLKEHILTKALLRENNYPHKHPDKAGFAIQYGDAKKGSTDVFRRICCRCGTSFSISQTGKHTRKEECNYHYGKVMENRVPGGVETRYSCCENAVGSPGCQVFKLHVHDAVSLQGFVSSLPQTQTPSNPGIYAIDTEMCYTTQGLELVRVTVVNSSLQVIYDTFVKPTNEVIDYNTRFSGVSEDDVKNCSSSLRDVQAVLLSFINERTILVGHGLENDLCALKLIHSTVVDTSVVFPHRLGPPRKRELRSLTAEYLRKIIQESVEGHDTQEDAMACMELMLWKVKEDAKGKRW
ncbi:RNA exonuclease 1 homolog isoform X2 [Pangasianodon hypophthalmus]|uniref:RNA exonuclease 1 homolog isoform X2 n=1 Tax=Pangasianodon hypophthalmus TaxID=310915 RepID=UPI00230739A4|nr:RNA exonuclease 1 homolog isoform X2 [Pangasianodon hypophthalmus]